MKKIKGLTRQQSEALLWCRADWRRIRKGAGVFQGRAIRPYVEFDKQVFHDGIKFYVRLQQAGIDLLDSLGLLRDAPCDPDRSPNDQDGEAGLIEDESR